MSQISNSEVETSDEINFQELLKPYLKQWKWFGIACVLAIAFAFYYIKKTDPVYEINSTVLVRDVKKSALDFGMMSELSSFGGKSNSTINNEMELLKSRKLMKEVVERLGIQVNVYSKKGIRKKEIFGETAPFIVNVVSEKKLDPDFKIEPVDVILSGDKIELSSESFKGSIVGTFNKTISLPYANIIITKNPKFIPIQKEKSGDLSFIYFPIESAVINLQKATDISLVDKEATVVGISIKYANIEKGKLIVNTLIDVYNDDAIKDKNSESMKTKEFIDERLSIISQELGSVETEKENFKNKNQIVDIPAETELNLESATKMKARLTDIQTELVISSDLINYMSKQGSNQVLPSAVGVHDPTASTNISLYNQLVLERSRLLENATPQNPAVIEISKQIASTKSAIIDNLVKRKAALTDNLSQVNQELVSVSSKIRKVPTWEKAFRNIERQQTIKENLYLILLQKREEAAITLATTTPKAKIVDFPYSSLKPVAPKKMLLLGGAIFVGLIIPFLFFYLKELLNNKIRTKHDLENLSNTNIVGELPSIIQGESEVVVKNDLSPMAEAFRILITNMNFLLPKKSYGKVIFVTSSVKGEGKTFTSVNMALTLATPAVKVLIIGADIRNPQLQRYNPENKNVAGLTEYLYDSSVKAKDVTFISNFNANCDIIYSGSIPPNPTELLTNGRVQELLDEVKDEYNYIIFDTAPLMLVTDTFLFSDMADVTIYVTRSRYTEKTLIDFANNAVKQNRIKNVAFVINDVKKEFFSYGNKYGYGYNVTESKKWWEFYKS